MAALLNLTAQVLGWLVLTGGVVAPLSVIVATLIGGPPAAGLNLSPREWIIFLRTLGVAAGATLLAAVIAVPACAALLHARRAGSRVISIALTVLPLLTPPCVFAYTWMLLASADHPIAHLLQAVGFNSAGAAPIRAAVALASWLWPIPALVAATSFRLGGLAAYRLARLDAGPAAAMLRAALPAVTAPVSAAIALTFLLALTDSTIPPLVLAHTWASEIAPDVLDATLYGSPLGAILWRSWPVLVSVLLAAAACVPGILRMRSWVEHDAAVDLGSAGLSVRWVSMLATGLLIAVSVLPALVFVLEMYSSPQPIGEALRRVSVLYETELRASLVVALSSGIAAAACALSVVRSGFRNGIGRRVRCAMIAGAAATAVLPPEVIAHALIRIFNRQGLPGTLYDGTPIVWILGIEARFVLLCIVFTWIASRQVPADLILQSRSDGATEAVVHARIVLPMLRRSLAAGALLVGALSLSEVAVSFLLIPPRFGGSLAVAIDNQMHYGRNNDLIVTIGVLLAPLTVVAFVMAVVATIAERRAASVRAARSARAR